jgi:hypothetical protein
MCFSAGASFAGAVVISAIGVATIREVHKPSQKLFATIPLFFAFQQVAEGVLWLTLKPGGNEALQSAGTYVFLLMALVVWPMMIPMAVLRLEENNRKKKLIKGIFGVGLILSLYYAGCLVNLNVYPRINQFHIQYINDFPKILGHVAFGIYAFVTIAPLFISSVKRVSLFGFLIIISFLITGIAFKEYLTSVWCFFAALISAVVYLIIRESQEELTLYNLRLMKLLSDSTRWRQK